MKLIDKKIKRASKEWSDKCLHWKQVFPKCEEQYKTDGKIDLYHLAESFSEALLHNSVFVSDSGLVELILPTNINFKPDQ